MTHDPKLVQARFLAALEIPAGPDRQRWLDEQCADDLQLKQRLQVLLDAHEATYGFDAQPSAASPPERAPDPVSSLVRPGTILAGRYKLLNRSAKVAWARSG